MSRIFLSHSSANNTEVVALRDWLKREGWEDVFLDVDPDRGIAAGERWERALNEADVARDRSVKSSLFETLQHVIVRCLRAELRGEPLSV